MNREQKERYRSMFSSVHSSWSFSEEDLQMNAHMVSQKKRRQARRILPIAVVVAALLALAVSAAATGLFGLADYLFPQRADTGQEMISLQGYTGSPEYQAAEEWLSFLSGYDPDGSILSAAGCTIPEGVPESQYILYNAYSGEMSQALEEIAARHALTLHTGQTFTTSPEELSSHVGNVLRQRDDFLSAGVYEDGSFSLDCSAMGLDFELSYQAVYNRKGYMSESYVTLDPSLTYQELTERTDGDAGQVMLAYGGDHGIALVELEHGFFVLNAHTGTDADGSIYVMTPDLLEELLARFDLTQLH